MGDTKILLRDFNAQLGRKKKYRNIIRNIPVQKFTNKNGS